MWTTYFAATDDKNLLALDLPCEDQGTSALNLRKLCRHGEHIVMLTPNAMRANPRGRNAGGLT